MPDRSGRNTQVILCGANLTAAVVPRRPGESSDRLRQFSPCAEARSSISRQTKEFCRIHSIFFWPSVAELEEVAVGAALAIASRSDQLHY
jgi:hypothetical protein